MSELEHDLYRDHSDLEMARFINLALLMCNGISDEDAGFDIITTLNDVGLAKIAQIIGNVRAAALSQEREACAKVAEGLETTQDQREADPNTHWHDGHDHACFAVAVAIRARAGE